jgi:hypothetical protein
MTSRPPPSPPSYRCRETGRRAGDAPLTIYADDVQRDTFVLELGKAGVAVRQLEPAVPPLEALFTALTGTPSEVAA